MRASRKARPAATVIAAAGAAKGKRRRASSGSVMPKAASASCHMRHAERRVLLEVAVVVAHRLDLDEGAQGGHDHQHVDRVRTRQRDQPLLHASRY